MDIFFGLVSNVRALIRQERHAIPCNPCSGGGRLPTGETCPFCSGRGER
jgi:RecJ-like exonuclease